MPPNRRHSIASAACGRCSFSARLSSMAWRTPGTATLMSVLLLVALVAWILVALYLLKRRSKGDVPRAVVSLIAGHRAAGCSVSGNNRCRRRGDTGAVLLRSDPGSAAVGERHLKIAQKRLYVAFALGLGWLQRWTLHCFPSSLRVRDCGLSPIQERYNAQLEHGRNVKCVVSCIGIAAAATPNHGRSSFRSSQSQASGSRRRSYPSAGDGFDP